MSASVRKRSSGEGMCSVRETGTDRRRLRKGVEAIVDVACECPLAGVVDVDFVMVSWTRSRASSSSSSSSCSSSY